MRRLPAPVLLALALAACGRDRATSSGRAAQPVAGGASPAESAKVGTGDLAGPPSQPIEQAAPDGVTDAGGVAPASLDAAGAPVRGLTQARAFRLTEPGCCAQPGWSADSTRVLYLDRPAEGALGIWSAPARPESEATLLTGEIASYTRDFTYRVESGESTTALERTDDGSRVEFPARGRPLSFSPSQMQVAWTTGGGGGPGGGSNDGPSDVWVANVDGSNARQVATVVGGGLSGWMGETGLLARGRENRDDVRDTLWRLDLADGSRRTLAHSERIRGELVSPNGRWVVYYVAGSADDAANGMFMASADGAPPRRMDDALFGAYRWRDGDHLLVIPQSVSGPAHQLLELCSAQPRGPATQRARHTGVQGRQR
jgi:hypothetical protein